MNNEEQLISERKDKISKFMNEKSSWAIFILLIVLVIFAFWMRTLNTDHLRDVSTNEWTLGPDLDPFLFLRWAEDIVSQGHIPVIDTMRYVPLGYNTAGELPLVSYMIAWFHTFATKFGISSSVAQSGALMPAYMFALTVISFFFFVRECFISHLGDKRAGIIALISSFFLTVIPSLIPRTIAGIPEKEAVAFFFMFLAFFFFIKSWKSNSLYWGLANSVLAGASTAAMALAWGGYAYVVVVLLLSMAISTLFSQVTKERIYYYFIWLISLLLISSLFSSRYNISGILTTPLMMITIFVGLTAILNLYLSSSEKAKELINQYKLSSIPIPLLSFLILAIIGLIFAVLILGLPTLKHISSDILAVFVTPVRDRLSLTVAENRQPFFAEWAGSFGPSFKGILISFWLGILGALLLMWFSLKEFEFKKRISMTLAFAFFIFAVSFSRYSSSSMFNGTNTPSLLFYASGFLVILGVFGRYYFLDKKEGTNLFEKIPFVSILILSFFFFSLVSARGAVRLVLILVPPVAILVGYLPVRLVSSTISSDSSSKNIFWAFAIIIILATIVAGYSFSKEAKAMSENYAPYEYTFQWQNAMAWVRNNTAENAVFGHWWDYGYWVQSIGKRATVLDGGNVYPYWNHLMGRYGLTGIKSVEAAEFLYAHNTTHFLIDSSDIGKYNAFSTIGSDIGYDRASWMPVLSRNDGETQETKNSTLIVYTGTTALDTDLVYNLNGTKLLLPSNKAGLAGVIMEQDFSGNIISNPIGVFVYNNQQYRIPLRYAYKDKLYDFNSGINAGVYLMPIVTQQAINPHAGMIYLSNRTVMSQLARLYLYNENDVYFKLVHSEDDSVVKQLKGMVPNFTSDIIYYNGIRGPIKIWEINYPSNITLKKEFLELQYPDLSLYKTS